MVDSICLITLKLVLIIGVLVGFLFHKRADVHRMSNCHQIMPHFTLNTALSALINQETCFAVVASMLFSLLLLTSMLF